MTSAPPHATRTAGRVLAWALAALLLVALAATVWIAVRGALAYGHLRSAEQTAHGLADAVRDPAQAGALVGEISADTRAARELTGDPVWRAAEGVPWVGPQLRAVSTVAAAVDDAASGALTPLASVASTFSIAALRPVDGRIDLSGFAGVQQAASTGADGLASAAGEVEGIDTTGLVGPLRRAVEEVSATLSRAAQTSDALRRAVTLLPAMLGQDGPRDYLVVFQNNAELRSLGGIVGATSLIHTDDGALSMVAQASSGDFTSYAEPVLDLGPELLSIHDTRPAQWIQNVTQVSDFSVSGALAREMWRRDHGTSVDGMLSLDPVALSYILQATGPVDLPTGDRLTAENAVGLLLNGVYLRYEDPAAQDRFFQAAAAAVFAKLTSAVDPAALVAALARAGDERRLLIWSAIPGDQAVLAGTTLTGPLPPDDATQRGFGVYLNDGTGSKMDYYARADTTLAWDACEPGPGGTATGALTLTVTIGNDAPADAASLPVYITGGGAYGVPPGTAKTVGFVYLPAGAELTQATSSDGGGFGSNFDDGRQVLTFGFELRPGASGTVTVRVRVPTPGAATAVAWVTPTVHPDEPTTVSAACPAG